MPNAVLVIDMVRGFMEPGHNLYLGERGRSIISNVVHLLSQEQSRQGSILYLCDNHDPEDPEFRIFGSHCIAGTIETEVIPELVGFQGEYIPKKRYSAFFNTKLDESLSRINPEKIIICGVCTEICVCYTASDARNRDYPTEIAVNCVAPCDEQAHQFALNHMEKVLGVKLIEIQ